MNKNRIIIIFSFLLALTTLPAVAQTLNDQQVLEFVEKSIEEGQDQRYIMTELARRGVSREQAERVKVLLKQKMAADEQNSKNSLQNQSRKRVLKEGQMDEDVFGKKNEKERKKDLFAEYQREDNSLEEDDLELDEEHEKLLLRRQKLLKKKQEEEVFGRNIFNTKELSFEPSVNLATPPNYRLGPGDEVIIDIWGTSQRTIREEISPDGFINIEKIGPVNLSGLTVSAANDHLRSVLSRTYSGLAQPDQNLNIQLSLGNTRTIQINVMGEVKYPGTYALSNFSTVFHALYRAGGISDIGSLRRVQLVRAGKQIGEIDVYDFILNGKIKNDIRLEEGDVVIVPAYEVMVQVKGKVKRPMKFEMRNGETLSSLVKYFGGFTSDAYTRSLRVISQNGLEYEVNSVKDVDYSLFKMRNGDVVTADAILNRFTNKLEIRGAVYRPGIYQLDGEVNTVRSLINEAQGLMGDAFTNRAVLQRERENFTSEIISVDVKGIMTGKVPDIVLQKNDVLYIPSIHDLEDRGEVTVDGEVAQPGKYTFSDNMTLEDLIIRAGGLKEAASSVRVDVSRRIRNPRNSAYTDSIGQFFTFSLKDGFVIEGKPGFVLCPYDQVIVRRSPAYQQQQNVIVQGEVLFGGIYAMTQRVECISDLLKKAGGVTPKAYVRGAKLTRRANSSELKRMEEVLKMMEKQFGSSMTDSLRIQVDSTFTVGINLEKALANPHGPEDLVLREGDVLEVPIMNNTVKINGAVMMPNTVAYKEGASVSYYLEQAGGYGLNAKKSKKFVIYMNGQVARVKNGDRNKIEPGCEIIVPSKKSKRTTVGEVLGYASSIGSLATMFATIGNLIK